MKLESRLTGLERQRGEVIQDRHAKQAELDRLTAKKNPEITGPVLSLPQRHQISIQVEELETSLRASAKLLAEIEVELTLVQDRIESERREQFTQEERPRRSREIEEAARQIMGNLWQAAVDNHDEAMARVVNADKELQSDIQRITGTPQPRSSRAVHLLRETTRFIRETVERSMKELP